MSITNIMEYIRENLHQLFNKNIVLMREIKRVLDTNDIYQTRSLIMMIKRECDLQANMYNRSQELQASFWKYYTNLFGESDHIPIRYTLKPRRSH